MSRNRRMGAIFVAVFLALRISSVVLDRVARVKAAAVQAPRFEVDPMWPKPLPNHWIYGNVIGVGVDTQDHVYIIHRGDAQGGGNLNEKEIYAAATPPKADCCVPAPPVLEFDSEGNL